MSREHGPQGEPAPEVDPFQTAVTRFNETLAQGYKGIDVADAFAEVQFTGLRTVQNPLDLYTQLTSLAGQAAEAAEHNSDTEYATRFRGDQQGFQRTVDALTPKTLAPQTAASSTTRRPKQSFPRGPQIRRATGRAAG